MAKLETKTKLIFIILFMKITTCGNASKIQDCGKKQVSFEDDISYHEDKISHVSQRTVSPERGYTLGSFIAMGIGGVLAVVAAPVVLAGVGFTAGGIAGGSFAAGMMSTAAVANGGAIAAGSTVAVLQSVGAAGLGIAGTAAVGTVGAAAGAGASVVVR